ncbi:hypothetical protein AArcSl_2599 [Halalkaliarchaeum desulfuricum]|uniref:Uncharacterized protein n=1 Tax=Halalkaliarchaeum desulfuricum TaxID=2055893 RepID=A0A343TM96_9EURY|nr:hypothetical protein [Halalkaliarchaeum desulfuricum]AUX10218.1 hypothetical protein AArcSl_2599 [Halalkaliarchaeum desulfuricum]
MSERTHDRPDEPSESTADGTTTAVEESRPAEESPSLEDLTLPERVLLAAIQDPVRGVVVVVLLLFAISFLIALAFIYPLVAAAFFLFSAIVLLAFVGYGIRQFRARERPEQ